MAETKAKNATTKPCPRFNACANALQITRQKKFRSNIEKMDPETRSLCLSSEYLHFVSGTLCAQYLLIENELGDGEDIDRFAILEGVLTPSFSVVCE